MKIKNEYILDLLNQVNYITDGVIESCRIGGDILENIQDQIMSLKKILTSFKAQHLTVQDSNIPADSKKKYLEKAEDLSKSKSFDPMNASSADLTAWVQAQAYAFIKKHLRENGMPEISANYIEIRNHVDIALCEWPKYKTHEKGFFFGLMQVVDDITDEILEHRNKNPQQRLFITD